MKTVLTLIVLATLTVGAFGQPKKKAPAPTCPVCHMPLSATKTASDPVAMRLTPKGKILYCCAKCKMPASMLVKTKKK